MPVDLYVGGVEHAVLHLLYARFWHKVLFDLGHVSTPEPFRRLVNQGLILGEHGGVRVPPTPAGNAGQPGRRPRRRRGGELRMAWPWSPPSARRTGERAVGRRVGEDQIEKRRRRVRAAVRPGH